MIRAAAVLNIHSHQSADKPHPMGTCPVCGGFIGLATHLIQTEAGQEWICQGCCRQIITGLASRGLERARRIIGGRA